MFVRLRAKEIPNPAFTLIGGYCNQHFFMLSGFIPKLVIQFYVWPFTIGGNPY